MQPLTKRIIAASTAAAAIAAGSEGLRLTPYKDPVGIATYCYGETHNVENRRYTKAECLNILNDDMRRVVVRVDSCNPDLPDSVLIAASDLAYNEGEAKVCEGTLHKLLAAKQYDEFCHSLLKYNHAGGKVLPGLTKRREVEEQECLDYQK